MNEFFKECIGAIAGLLLAAGSMALLVMEIIKHLL